ncbi:unnamed protein product, partial [Prorocentrum cordatum]
HYGHTGSGMGLAAICESVLGEPLCKEPALRCSDWGGALSPEQVRYAACDAVVAVAILAELHRAHPEPGGLGLASWCGRFVGQTKSPRGRARSGGPPGARPPPAWPPARPRSAASCTTGARCLAPPASTSTASGGIG